MNTWMIYWELCKETHLCQCRIRIQWSLCALRSRTAQELGWPEQATQDCFSNIKRDTFVGALREAAAFADLNGLPKEGLYSDN
jgi:hypothetical protein